MVELHATPSEVAKFLKVTERSVWRWLADDSAPFAVLAALWHETPTGREHSHADVAYDLVLTRGMARCHAENAEKAESRLCRLLAICDTGATNDPFFTGPSSPPPSGGRPRLPAAAPPDYLRLRN